MQMKDGVIKCFSKRTPLEKVLFLATAVLLFSLVGIIVAYQSTQNAYMSPIPICDSDACKAVGSAILRSLDRSIDPCQDFYSYVCGGWNKSHSIPEDAAVYDVTKMLNNDVLLKVNDLLANKENVTLPRYAENAITFYDSCINTENIEDLGVKPLLELLNDIGGWPVIDSKWKATNYDFLSAMAQIQLRTSYGFVVLVMVSTDPLNTSSSILQLHKPSLSMSMDILLNQDKEWSQKELKHYKNFFINIATLLGAKKENLSAEFNSIIQFETKLATFITPESELKKFDSWYNKRIVKDLKDNFTSIDWLEYLQMVTNSSLGTMTIHGDDEVILRDMKYLMNLNNFLKEKTKSSFKRWVSNYLGWRLITSKLQFMPSRFDEALQNYSRDSGYPRIPKERWKMCTSSSISEFSDGISLLYIRKHFPKDVKKEVMKLVLDLRFQFEMTLDHNHWMDKNTTKAALTKLRTMGTNIGYPPWMDDVEDTDDYQFENQKPKMTTNIFENDLALSQHMTMEAIRKIRKRNDNKSWSMNPIIVNAGYNRNLNAITFPAAFLQEPLFNPKAPRFYNYAAIGSIIGHEVTHGFDNEGRLRNGSGVMKDWWSKNSAAAFQERANCFVKQYNNYQLNGTRTLPENIADNGGLRQAYAAYMQWKNDGAEVLALPNLDGFSIDQQFFLAYGTIWCAKYRPEAWTDAVLHAIHSPSRYRLLGTLANLPEFSEAFRCKPESTNIEEEKCIIW